MLAFLHRRVSIRVGMCAGWDSDDQIPWYKNISHSFKASYIYTPPSEKSIITVPSLKPFVRIAK